MTEAELQAIRKRYEVRLQDWIDLGDVRRDTLALLAEIARLQAEVTRLKEQSLPTGYHDLARFYQEIEEGK